MKKLGVVVLLWSVLQAGAWAGFEEGLAAAERGEYATALKEWQPLAEAGDTRAQYVLGRLYYKGKGVQKNDTEAVKWWRLAANQGYANSQYSLGEMYQDGRGVPKNGVEAVKWYRLAASQGLIEANFALGYLYSKGGSGVPKNKTEAIKWFQRAANQGGAAAKERLGFIYEQGQDVPKNYTEAAKWYKLAADEGHAEAQTKLGNFYEEGQGVPKSYTEAARWYRLAADQGYTRAQYYLGLMYYYGYGVPKSHEEAVRWLEMSADNDDSYWGSGSAASILTLIYEWKARSNVRDDLMSVDFMEAIKWHRRIIARRGYSNANSSKQKLAEAYAEGRGVKKNIVVAYALYNFLAVESADMAEKRDSFDFGSSENRLTPEQRRTAQAISVKLQNSDDFLRTLDEAVQQTTGK